MTEQELMIQSQGGTCIALLLIAQALIATHPNKADMAKVLSAMLDSDLPVVVAMRAAGKPKLDEAFRETMQGVLNFAEQQRGAT